MILKLTSLALTFKFMDSVRAFSASGTIVGTWVDTDSRQETQIHKLYCYISNNYFKLPKWCQPVHKIPWTFTSACLVWAVSGTSRHLRNKARMIWTTQRNEARIMQTAQRKWDKNDADSTGAQFILWISWTGCGMWEREKPRTPPRWMVHISTSGIKKSIMEYWGGGPEVEGNHFVSIS